MLNLLLFLALSASTPPAEGRWLYIGEDADGMGVIDASRVEREGDRARVLVIVALPQAIPGEGQLVQYVQEWDCPGRRYRMLDGHAFDRAVSPTVPIRRPGVWETSPEESPFDRVRGHVCEGRVLPEAGADYRPILERFLAKQVI